MTPADARICVLTLLLLLTGCCGVPADLETTRHVVITNRSSSRLVLCEAERDGWGSRVPLPRAERITLDVPPGRYALQLGDGRHFVPLPLPPDELGFVPPDTTRLTVQPWPEPEPGWCWIPGGPGLFGDSLGIGQEDERPLRTPTTPGFWLAQEETSNAQFVRFLNALPGQAVDRAWLDLDGAKCGVHWDADTRRFGTDAPDFPVVTVSWHGAVAYCRWLSESTGVCHRLPSEIEWERAARGPGSRVYAYGDTYRTDGANQESGRLRRSSDFPSNGFGLAGMTGNAFEWCAELYQGRSSEPGTPELRVLRGGSFVLDGIFVRNAMRMRLRPGVRADDVGFRVLREHSGSAAAPAAAPSR